MGNKSNVSAGALYYKHRIYQSDNQFPTHKIQTSETKGTVMELWQKYYIFSKKFTMHDTIHFLWKFDKYHNIIRNIMIQQCNDTIIHTPSTVFLYFKEKLNSFSFSFFVKKIIIFIV